jgi:hypothetical protein
LVQDNAEPNVASIHSYSTAVSLVHRRIGLRSGSSLESVHSEPERIDSAEVLDNLLEGSLEQAAYSRMLLGLRADIDS